MWHGCGVILCPACSSDVPAGSRFCPSCGGPLETRTSAPTEATKDAPAVTSHPSLDQARFIPGTVLARRYRIIALLGRGGMGEVYRADDLKLGQPVALKFLPEAVQRDAERGARFLNEVRVAVRVTHPNVCRVHDIGEVDGQPFISMEYVDGEDLASLLRRIGRLPSDRAVQVARQLCAGLAAAHEQGILHRDLKPANVMIDGRGRAKITDFGLAGLAEGIEEERVHAGTPAYMAPEQLRGGEATNLSDIYALGLVLYELFTGRRAFQASSIGDLIELQESSSPPSLTGHVGDLDPAVDEIVRRCLERDSLLRPQSALTVSAALPGGDLLAAALAAGETPSPDLVAAAGRSVALHPAVAVGLVGVTLAGALLVMHLTGQRSELAYLPLDKPPVVMLDRAREMVRLLGVDYEPADSGYGYSHVWDYRRWIDRTDHSPDRWNRLRRARPVFVHFWYRQSRGGYERSWWDLDRGALRSGRPRWSRPNEVYLSLDLEGNLRRFFRVPEWRLAPARSEGAPPAHGSDVESGSVDYQQLFRLAGLDLGLFAPAEPRQETRFRAGSRRAWVGVYPEDPRTPLRVEVGTDHGRLAHFLMLSPWDEPEDAWPRTAEPQEAAAHSGVLTPLLKVTSWLEGWAFLVNTFLLLLAPLLAARNLKAGRGDVRGATRVAGSLFVVGGLSMFLDTDRLAFDSENEFLFAISVSLAVAVVAGGAYLGIEPTVRRYWPTMLVAWTRLISGRFRDPLVGRSLLVGVLFGVAFEALRRGAPLIEMSTTLPPPWPRAGLTWWWWDEYSLERSTLVHLPFATVAGVTMVAMLGAFLYLFILVLLKRLTARPWLAATLTVPILTIVAERNIGSSGWTLLSSLVVSVLVVVVYLKFGFLAAVTARVSEQVFSGAVCTDLTAWYGRSSLVSLAFVLLIAILGAHLATRSGGTSIARGRPAPA